MFTLSHMIVCGSLLGLISTTDAFAQARNEMRPLFPRYSDSSPYRVPYAPSDVRTDSVLPFSFSEHREFERQSLPF